MPIFEMRRTPLITPQIIQNQMALNLALSSVPRNVWSAGARARTLFNVNPPGKDVLDDDGKPLFEVGSMTWGAAVVNFLNGAPIVDEETGKVTGYANPSMQVEEPVEVRPSKEAVDVHTWEIHANAQQLHALTSTETNASGLKLLVARLDYLSSLTDTKPEADKCLGWQMNTRLAMAEAFSEGREGQRAPHRFTALLRANAKCKLDPGPITPEERTALDQLVQNGTLSEETALQLMGVEDVAEEKRRKAAEKRVDTILTLIERTDNLGMDREQALVILGGMNPEEAKALARGDLVNGITQ
jgi:hypothetical protein